MVRSPFLPCFFPLLGTRGAGKKQIKKAREYEPGACRKIILSVSMTGVVGPELHALAPTRDMI